MLVDSHSHLAHPYLKNDLESIISTAINSGVTKIISIGCTIGEAEKSLEIAKKHSGVYSTAGLYPRDPKNEPASNLSLGEKLAIIEKLAIDPKIVAIGECGLDFSPCHPEEIDNTKEEQYEKFIKQMELSERHNKPLVIHSRNAVEETLQTIRNFPRPINAVWHCFSENSEIANRALDLGLHISFTGNITYPKNIELRNTVKITPLDKIMIETDAPYLIPQRAREAKVKINTPQYVKMVAEEIASIKGISFEEVAEATTSNALAFFGLEP